MKHVLRIVRAAEARRFSTWREEDWVKAILDAHFGVSTLPETTYESLTALQNFLFNSLQDGLHVYQSHSMETPTVDGDPSPTRLLLPAPANSIPPGPPTPKAEFGALGAEAEQGGGSYDVPPPDSVPLRSSLLFPSQENRQQRSDVPADQGATRNVGFVPVVGQSEGPINRVDEENQGVNALMERDALIADLQRQVRELQGQNNVQNDVQNNVSSRTRSGVTPNRSRLV